MRGGGTTDEEPRCGTPDREPDPVALCHLFQWLQRYDLTPAEVLSGFRGALTEVFASRGHIESRVELGGEVSASPGYEALPGRSTELFETGRGVAGLIDVARRPAEGGALLEPERALLRELAAMLRSHFDNRERVSAPGHRRRDLSLEITLAEERQRRAIARDLHDHLGQALAFIRMHLSDLQGDLIFSGVEQRLNGIRDLLDKAIRYTRTLTAEISPPVLYDLGFRPAVEWVADRLGERHSLPVTVRSEGDLEIREEAIRVVLFLAVRELLVNAAKHASARTVEVTLTGVPREIRAVVRDDGVGFDPARARDGDGFGLYSVSERIRALGGEIEIDSAPGRGARVTLTLPRTAARDADPDRR